jgi:hypothetical protein
LSVLFYSTFVIRIGAFLEDVLNLKLAFFFIIIYKLMENKILNFQESGAGEGGYAKDISEMSQEFRDAQIGL